MSAQAGPEREVHHSWFGNLTGRLYRGEVSFDFVNRQKLWYIISGAILGISVLALLIFGLNFSIDFKGGSLFHRPGAARRRSTRSSRPSRPTAAGPTPTPSRSGRSAARRSGRCRPGS